MTFSPFLVRAQFSSKIIRVHSNIPKIWKPIPTSWDDDFPSPDIWYVTMCYYPISMEDFKKIKDKNFGKQYQYIYNNPICGFKIIKEDISHAFL